ncbi:hypothetical protein IWZ03DRAFT_405562 [Phyllosticta citriasiana]|uniref:Uncharacterized protein n=1 Tax=Phyllosticta citriasiana TaxID=595635 RepID=A0ABR1KU47_9PEZI
MESPEESPAQRQARLRRERRQAKINSQGASRLEAITSLSGRPAPAPEEPSSDPSPKPTAPPPSVSASSTSTTTGGGAAATPTSSSAETDDPPEIDISQHYYAPTSRPARSLTPSTPASGQLTPGTPDNGSGNPNDDPMMRMMQQMLRGGGPPGMDGAAGPGGAAEGEDPMLQMLQQMMGGGGGIPDMPGATGAPQQGENSSNAAYVWRIVHALISLSLAIYIALGSAFDGTKVAREHGQSSFDGVVEIGGVNIGQRLFWMFATVEVVLQSTRFFVEKGRLQQGGLMGTLSTILPEPYAGYLRMAGRYSVIYTTVVADAMVVVFVLGAVTWWKGLVAN